MQIKVAFSSNDPSPCQSGRRVGAGLALATLAGFGPAAVAGSASWAHQAGSLSSNGSVIVKSLAGGSYAANHNPIGAVAKVNQVAATQPPTVIIQATSSGLPFNYKDDCYFLNTSDGNFVGLGKLPTPTTFTGIVAPRTGNVGATFILAAALGGGVSGSGSSALFAPNSTSFSWAASAGGSYVTPVVEGTVISSSKCFP